MSTSSIAVETICELRVYKETNNFNDGASVVVRWEAIIDYEHFQTWLNKPWPKAHKSTPEIPSHPFFPPILTIFELVHEINKTNILTKFHDREKCDLQCNFIAMSGKLPSPPVGHVFQPTRTIFELKKRHIIYTNILAK
ncbi:hypothetical protein DPMN_045594 [Dreissena polymorpha]|uniref:Uncharacterized protein n=1 Tax=Dreissena polymorpha TaxID=45954 RepID=A0A9D4D6G0_DREPO|nr:hypothetical protein DPMN_045594 [Dreissena polymorpha]